MTTIPRHRSVPVQPKAKRSKTCLVIQRLSGKKIASDTQHLLALLRECHAGILGCKPRLGTGSGQTIGTDPISETCPQRADQLPGLTQLGAVEILIDRSAASIDKFTCGSPNCAPEISIPLEKIDALAAI
jgi:hypothetical protein